MALLPEECPYCFEEVLVGQFGACSKGGVVRFIDVNLQPDEIEVLSESGEFIRGHERHWKYCSKRPEGGTVSAEPKDEHHEES